MNPHFELLEKAQQVLSILNRTFVFVGGATVSLHLDDPAAGAARATEDIDLVVEVTGYPEYVGLEEQLRNNDFAQLPLDQDSPICRWTKDELLLDVMPTDPKLIGFSSTEWFQRGFDNAQRYELPTGTTVEAFDAVHLMAAKIEAFVDRANGDWLRSKDAEDLATILDGRSSIFEELDSDDEAAEFVRHWLKQHKKSLTHRLAGHVGGNERAAYLVERLHSTGN